MPDKYLLEYSDVEKTLQSLAGLRCGFDIESGQDAGKLTVAGFSLYNSEGDAAYYVPLNHKCFSRSFRTRQLICRMLEQIKLVTYSGAYDVGVPNDEFDIRLNVDGDGGIVANMLQMKIFGLKPILKDRGLMETTISLEDVLGPGNFDFTLAPLDEKTLAYTCQDARGAFILEADLLEKEMKPEEHPNWSEVYRLECDTLAVLERATHGGLRLDVEEFRATCALMAEERDQLHVGICGELNRNPDTFKIGSTKRLAGALYNSPNEVSDGKGTIAQQEMKMPGLGLPVFGNKRSTNQAHMELLEEYHPVISRIREWKSLNAVVTRDLPQIGEFVQTEGEFSFLYPGFKSIGVDGTSRIYGEAPNVTGLSAVCRRSIKPMPGRVFAHCDYSSNELYLMLLMSGQADMIRVLQEGRDPHRYTYSQMTGTPYNEVTKDQREVGKVLNYAPLYGATEYRISLALGVDFATARNLLETFWETFPAVQKWVEAVHEYCTKHGRTHTILHRTRKLTGVWSRNPGEKKAALRQSVNTACQGSSGDLLKLAIRALDQSAYNGPLKVFNAELKCVVFDAALLELDESALEDQAATEAMMRECMEIPFTRRGITLHMPLDIKWSRRDWAEASGK